MNKNSETSSLETETCLPPDSLHEFWDPERHCDTHGVDSAGVGSLDTATDFQAFALRVLSDVAAARSPGLDWIRAALVMIQNLTGAERIFFFDVTGLAATPVGDGQDRKVEFGQCLVALDFDREPISKPEGKIPSTVLRWAVENHRAVFVPDTIEAPPTDGSPAVAAPSTRGYAAVPLVASESTHGVVYFEHRFQPLRVPASRVGPLILLLRAVSFRHATEKILSENQSLWADLLTQREKLKAIESATAPPTLVPRRPKTKGRDTLNGNYDAIIGSSSAMMEILQLLDRIRSSNAPVLINGESGTGKELVANAIHQNGPRNGKSFVSENCGALTETLLESELFGYVKGAFTGASRDHKGLFELADGGTLFLDEVGDMSPAMQKKLLRSVQEGVIRRVGGKEYIHVDVRIISATNKDLLEEVRRGAFREDLYYRLNVINLKLPPLRERGEDIPDLVHTFLDQLVSETGVAKTVTPQALQLLMNHHWPGNIRELQNEIKRLFALSDDQLEVAQLSETIRCGEGLDLLSSSLEDELRCLTLKDALEKVEKALIKRALITAQGNKSQVAKLLRIPKTSLYNKISKYRLDRSPTA